MIECDKCGHQIEDVFHIDDIDDIMCDLGISREESRCDLD